MTRIIKTIILSLSALAFSSTYLHAQNKPHIEQDPKLDFILELKEKLEDENKLFNGYTIQLHNGSLNKAKEVKKEYERTKSIWPSTIEYETPNYKLWVGNFDTRLDADRALLKLRKDFPTAFVLKPERK